MSWPDVNEPPFLEMCISCDNLRCDGDGRPPSPRVSVQVLNPPQTAWLQYAQTEVIEVSLGQPGVCTVIIKSDDTEGKFFSGSRLHQKINL